MECWDAGVRVNFGVGVALGFRVILGARVARIKFILEARVIVGARVARVRVTHVQMYKKERFDKNRLSKYGLRGCVFCLHPAWMWGWLRGNACCPKCQSEEQKIKASLHTASLVLASFPLLHSHTFFSSFYALMMRSWLQCCATTLVPRKWCRVVREGWEEGATERA